MWDFMKNESPPDNSGYVFWDHNNVMLISELLDTDAHSGYCFSICMKNMEFIAKKGWDNYVNYINKTQ